MKAIEHLWVFSLEFLRNPTKLEESMYFHSLNRMEKTLARDLIRNLLFIEMTGENFIRKFRKFPCEFRALFITGSFEILFAEKITTPEIISPLLGIVDRYSYAPAWKKILHGALGNISRKRRQILQDSYPLAVRFSYPQPVFEVLKNSLPSHLLEESLSSMHHPLPGLGFLYNPYLLHPRDMEKFLKEHDCQFWQSPFHTYYIHVKKGTDYLLNSSWLEEGKIYVQDMSMAVLARKMATQLARSRRILDYCAAPGGKTIALAGELYPENPLFVCHDVDEHRLQLLRENLQCRPWINAIIITSSPCQVEGELPASDFRSFLERNDIPRALRGKILRVRGWEDSCSHCFDTVLVDAPCSGLGTIHKYPEIKYLFQEDASFIRSQYELLKKAKEFVKMSGILYYITCTLNKRENEELVSSFLKQELAQGSSWTPLKMDSEDFLRIIPSRQMPSGGFLAGMCREQERSVKRI